VNMLNIDEGWSPSLGAGRRVITKNWHVTKCYTGPGTWLAILEGSKERKLASVGWKRVNLIHVAQGRVQ
jgi:hypothetical protein